VPGLVLVSLFAGYAALKYRHEARAARRIFEHGGPRSPYLDDEHFDLGDKLRTLPRALPFVVLLLGVMAALYGGYATASETAGLGAVLALLLILIVYRMWRPRDLAPVFASTLKESTMLMFIIGMSVLYAYVMSFLHISQSAAEWIVALALPRWALLAATLLLVVALGFFLPPVSIILMTAPIVLPPLKAAGFDLIWFGVVMTVVMEMGLIHPPVGLNIFVIRNIAPDIPLSQIIRGVVPLLALMIAAVVLMSVFPHIATVLPDAVMGSGR
jgi:tripartite ATP-independent transporter DctM subunit